jgi:coronin-1B/1C/6
MLLSSFLAAQVWDVERGEAMVTLDGFGGLVQDFDWNHDGSLLATSSKDKMLRTWDPRTLRSNSEAVYVVAPAAAPATACCHSVHRYRPRMCFLTRLVPIALPRSCLFFPPPSTCSAHEGVKCFKLVWLGESNNILTCGFTKQSKREFRIFDMRDLTTPLFTQEIDQASGVLMPFYDPDLKILYLAGKGDGNIRYYELADAAPFSYPLSEHRTSVSAKGLAMLPKRACNPLKVQLAFVLFMLAWLASRLFTSVCVPFPMCPVRDCAFPEADQHRDRGAAELHRSAQGLPC